MQITFEEVATQSTIAEQLTAYGPDRMATGDLIAAIVGRPTKIDMPINELARLSLSEIERYTSPKAALRIAAALELGRRSLSPRQRDTVLETPLNVYAYCRPRMAHLTREVFHVLLLDSRHRLVADRRVAEGGLASCAISARDVFEPAIREAAPAMIFVHNHPSGDPTPSQDDILLTARLLKAAKLLGLSLIDHVVVADGGFSSLAEMGKL